MQTTAPFLPLRVRRAEHDVGSDQELLTTENLKVATSFVYRGFKGLHVLQKRLEIIKVPYGLELLCQRS